MKRLLLIIMFLCGAVFAQDTTLTIYNYTSLSLTHEVDTADVTLHSDIWDNFDRVTITAVSGSDTDTINVYTRKHGTLTQKELTDMLDKSSDEQIIVTTTAKEFLIYDSDFKVLRLVIPDDSADLTVEITPKRTNGL